ncbi:MAG: type II secretion system F family protein [Acetatifactor sp.]|nr:type II secretion system F family protein [Acetatifactor sp.]MDE7355055.1 type II secretion system F family protein [Acetatifactor sp.]
MDRWESGVKKGLFSIFYNMALFLYKKACRWGLPFFSSRQVEADLIQLHPGENIEWVRTDYYVKKLGVILAILLIGGALGAAVKLSALGMSLLDQDGRIARGGCLDGAVEWQLVADDGSGRRDFRLLLFPRTLTEEEAEDMLSEFRSALSEYILGENQDLQHITFPLNLRDSYEGYPFWVEWESSRPEILDHEGNPCETKTEEKVTLRAEIAYVQGGYSWKEDLSVTVVPLRLTPQEQSYRELEEYLTLLELEKRGEEAFQLPSSWQGRELRWRRRVEDNSLLLWAMALAASVLIYHLSDRDLHERLEKRKKLLKHEYPDVVYRLVLLVGAGMTIRGAFQKMAGDYERKRKKGTGVRPAWDEILYTCRELRSGVSEGAAYEHFGRRTGLREYVRLSALLAQNLKKGNSMLLERLREEAEKTGEERLLRGKRMGEEAGTKLLVPMVLMLAVVMVMIMVPAFGIL